MKRISLTIMLLSAASLRLAAQGICDSVVSIAPIQALCQGTGERYLEVSHPGGVFSGPGLLHNTNYLSARNLGAGTFTATYTITGPGGCTVQATRTFDVLPAEEAFAWVSGEIDCSNPNSVAGLHAITIGGNTSGEHWSGQGEFFQGVNAQTGVAGEYLFTAYDMSQGFCPQYAYVNVDYNQPPAIQLVSCTDCNDPTFLKVKTEPQLPGWNTRFFGPNGATIAGFSDCIGISPSFPTGTWTVEAKNPANGCVSTASAVLNPDYARPSVSAGSDISLGCGFTPNLLAAMAPQSGQGYQYFWERPDGSTSPASYGGLLPVFETGVHVLHGVNTFTGCEHTDTAMVTQAATPVSSQIAIICDGESVNGHTQPGNYVDTILQLNGCPIIQYTKLIVLAPLLETADIQPDNGTGIGSISVQVVQGWGPFSYNWNNGEFTPAITQLSAGLYQLTITDVNGCTHVREYLVPLNRPAKKDRGVSAALLTQLYPNPVSRGSVAVWQINSDLPGEARLQVCDVLGRMVSQRVVSIQAGENTYPVAEGLPAGTYSLRLQSAAGVLATQTLVVE